MRVLLAVVAVLLLAPSAAGAALPKPIGEPGGVYRGSIRIAAQTCKGCGLRLVVSQDGLEVTEASRAKLQLHCGFDHSADSFVGLARAHPGGRFTTTVSERGGGSVDLRGRLTPTRISGTGTCGSYPTRRVTFRLRIAFAPSAEPSFAKSITTG